jgi:hypothetical protein
MGIQMKEKDEFGYTSMAWPVLEIVALTAFGV